MMRDSEKGGEKPIKAVKELRSRKAKLERVARSATKKEKPQESLQRQKDFYKAVMGNTFFGFTLIDRDYTIVLANSMESVFFRKPVSELIGKKCFREFEKRRSICPHCPGKRAMATGRPAEVETEGVRDDGSRFSAHIQAFPVIQQDGAVTGFIEIVNDITERKQTEQKIQDALQYAHKIIETVRQPFLVLDKNLKVVSSNNYFYETFKVKSEETEGQFIYNLGNRQWDIPELRKLLNEILPEKRTFEKFEIRHDFPHIGPKIMLLNAHQVDEVQLILLAIEDITDRKKAEQEKDKLLKAIEIAEEAVSITTPDTIITYANDAMDELFGYEKGQLVGKHSSILNAGSPQKVRDVPKEIADTVRKTGVWEGEIHNKRKDGTEFISYARISALKDKDGKILNFVSTQHDITERKKASKALAQSESRFRSLVEHLPQKIFIKDKNSVFLFSNQNYARDLKIKPEEIIGKTDYDFYSKELAEKYRADDKRIIETGITEDIEEKYIANGEERWIHTIKTPYKNGKGNIIGVLGIFRDISEYKKASQKIYDYQQQLKALSSQLSLIEERAKRKIAAELHDNVGQRLATAKLELQSLMRSSPGSEMSESINDICGEITHIMDDVRSLTFELGNPLLDKIGLTAALEKYITEEIQAKFGIKCELIDEAGDQDMEETVSTVLYRSTRELLINSVKHAQAHNIKVRIYLSVGNICICVEDDGVGFEVSEIALLPAKTGGFGLFSIKEQLEYIGGNLQIESKVGHGTKVTISCPPKLEKTAQV